MVVHELSRADARRIAVRAQLLDKARPGGLLAVVRHLTLLQIDPTNSVAPNVDLVVWSRLGSACPLGAVDAALERGDLLELDNLVRPRDDVLLHTADMAEWPGRGERRDWQDFQGGWVEANDGCRRDILERLELGGPLTSRELPDTCEVPWQSTGWTNNRNVIRLLEFMVRRGEVAVAGRKGRERLWDLSERVYPDEPPVPWAEARRIRADRRLRSLGLARALAPETQVEPGDVGEAGEPAVVEGVRGRWRVDPAQLGQPFRGRAALLSPLDRLVYDRKRMAEIFEFDYQLEMYKPKAKRRWGYFALPILYGDRLVGKVDATADRKAGVLRVDAVHRDVDFTAAMTRAVDAEIDDLARWLGLDLSRGAA